MSGFEVVLMLQQARVGRRAAQSPRLVDELFPVIR